MVYFIHWVEIYFLPYFNEEVQLHDRFYLLFELQPIVFYHYTTQVHINNKII
jgi:hypothetical protein